MSSGGTYGLVDEARRDFFISRAGESSAWGLWIARELETEGYSVIYQERDFRNGELLMPQIGDANSCAERTLVVVSKATFQSEWTKREYSMAKRMLLFRVADVALRPELDAAVYTDLFNLPEETAREMLLRIVRQSYGPPQHPHQGDITAAVPFPATLAIKSTPVEANGANLVEPTQTSPALAAPKVAKDVLENVAYLCDRGPQANRLETILKKDVAWQGTVICIAHGDETERVERFVTRLHKHSIPAWIARSDRPIRDIFVEWPKVTRSTTAESFRRDLSLAAEKQMVARKLDGGAIAIVRSNLLVASWCTDRGVVLIREFTEFWRTFPTPPGSLLVVCLVVRYPVERRASILQRVQRFLGGAPSERILFVLEGRSEDRIDCHVLPRLEPIERHEADNWTELPEVRRYRTVDLEEIRGIYEDLELEAIPMGDLAPRLVDLLTNRKDSTPHERL